MVQKRKLSPEQDMAANPSENVWVQANAGTGKTSVLVQRLLRILFRSENLDSCGILCLTYTNAGAGEMRNRILAALREWAMSSDDDLKQLLDGIPLNKDATDADIAHARQIFFTYIDKPELLKIKTIHGFCEEILHRFPLEAGISPSWSLVSDANQRVLLQDAFDSLITSDNTTVGDAFAYIVGRVSEHYMTELLDILSGQYKHFFQVENFDNYRKYFIDTTKYFLKLNFVPNTEIDTKSLENILQMATSVANSSKKPANYILDVINLTKQYIDNTIDFEEYKKAYLTDKGGKDKYVAKCDFLVAEQERVYAINQYNINKIIFKDTMAIFDLSAAFARAYRQIKTNRNVLDFEDLILYTKKLFSNPSTMGWVLSQLNVRLSHILVDEAQDTSPLQWDILRMMSGDFFTDGDTAGHEHSLFVVGDSKQSIYGFQGADPLAFVASRDDIRTQIEQNMRTIREIPLAQSFRSLGAILYAVDTFFDNKSVQQMTGFKNNQHKCFRQSPDGLVEIHKLVSKKEDETDVAQYIKTIADKIEQVIASGEYAAKDIMVLVQQRRPFAAPLVDTLKRRGIDVAGSDRIVLPDFPAVRDLLNLIRFCLNRNDDYNLCCVLKSPLFRLTEQQIFEICSVRNSHNVGRDKSEFITVDNVLCKIHPDIAARLNQIYEWGQTLAPYSFFEQVLNTNNARAEMISALGTQILDPLAEFMTICLSYERTQTGTLKHFLKWFITGGSEIKRDMDASSGVRVVTVHGSKGLEAPVVFLIDTVHTPKSEKVLPITPEIMPANIKYNSEYPAPWLWIQHVGDSECRTIAADAVANTKIAEYYRLLYVAMTRARDCLYVYGFTPNKNAPDIAWHTQLWNVLADDKNATVNDNTIRITKWQNA